MTSQMESPSAVIIIFLALISASYSYNCGSPITVGEDPSTVYQLNNKVLRLIVGRPPITPTVQWSVILGGKYYDPLSDPGLQVNLNSLIFKIISSEWNGSVAYYEEIKLVTPSPVVEKLYKSGNMTILLGEPPQASPRSVDFTPFHNESVTRKLQFSKTGSPKPESKLIRIDKPLENATAEKFNLSDGELTFSNLLFPHESGVYGINISNCFNFTIITVNVSIIVILPTVEVQLSDVAYVKYEETDGAGILFAIAGSNLSVPFIVTGNPQPAVTWTASNATLSRNQSVNGRLSLPNIQPGVQTFALSASNLAGDAQTSFTVHTYDFQLDEFLYCSQDDYIELLCTASAHPGVFVTLLRNGVPMSRKVLISHFPSTLTSVTAALKIPKTSIAARDRFACKFGAITANEWVISSKTVTARAKPGGCMLDFNQTTVAQATSKGIAAFTVPCLIPRRGEPSFNCTLEDLYGILVDVKVCDPGAYSVTLVSQHLSPGNYCFFLTVKNAARSTDRMILIVDIEEPGPGIRIFGFQLFVWIIIVVGGAAVVLGLVWNLLPLNPTFRHWLQENCSLACYDCYDGCFDEKRPDEIEADVLERPRPSRNEGLKCHKEVTNDTEDSSQPSASKEEIAVKRQLENVVEEIPEAAVEDIVVKGNVEVTMKKENPKVAVKNDSKKVAKNDREIATEDKKKNQEIAVEDGENPAVN